MELVGDPGMLRAWRTGGGSASTRGRGPGGGLSRWWAPAVLVHRSSWGGLHGDGHTIPTPGSHAILLKCWRLGIPEVEIAEKEVQERG